MLIGDNNMHHAQKTVMRFSLSRLTLLIKKVLQMSPIVLLTVAAETKAESYTTTVSITDGAEINFYEDTNIDVIASSSVATGSGIYLSGQMGTVTAGDNVVLNINVTEPDSGVYNSSIAGISANNSSSTSNGDTMIKLGETHITSVKYGIHASTPTSTAYQTIITLGDNSSINANSTALNIQRNATVTLGDYARISAGSSGVSVGAITAAQGATINIGDEAIIGNTNTNGNSIGVIATGVLASTPTQISTITIGERVTISTSETVLGGSHAVKAGTGGFSGNPMIGLINIRNDAKISTVGASSYGLYATVADSVINVGTGAEISTTGTSSYAVYSGVYTDDSASSAGGATNIGDDATITTSGSSAHAVYADKSGSITIGDNATISTTDSSAYAVYAANAGQIILNGGKISASDYAIYSTDASSQVTGNGVFDIDGTIYATTNGSVGITFEDDSYFKGQTSLETAGTIDFDMSGTDWTMLGNSNLTNLMFSGNQSTVTFSESGNYNTLTVEKLSGENGLFNMRTDIVGDGSGVNNQGDLLVITDSSSGTHQINVVNNGSVATDGTETLTVIDTADGGATFTLTNQVEAGAYLYDLRQASNATDWELYSVGQKSNSANNSISILNLNYLMNYIENQTLMQRMGELRQTQTEGGDTWGRVYGGKLSSFDHQGLKGSKLNYWGLQLGVDKNVNSTDKWDVYVGILGGISKGSTDFSVGDGNIDSYYGGIYGTYKEYNGFYIDLIAKYFRTKNQYNTVSSSGYSVKGDSHSNGYNFGFEIGKRFELNSKNENDGWFVEPQIQLNFTHYDSTTIKSSNGLKTRLNNFDSYLGRIGTLLGYSTYSIDSNPVDVYLKLSYIKEYKGDTSYTFNDKAKEAYSFKGHWIETGVGINTQINSNHNVYMDYTYATGNMFNQKQINLGYRYNF